MGTRLHRPVAGPREGGSPYCHILGYDPGALSRNLLTQHSGETV